jgi:hypothetical protein
MTGRIKFEVVESTLRLPERGLELKYRTAPGHGFKGDDTIRFDAVRVDAKIKDVIIDNVDHGSTHEQEIRIDLSNGMCVTPEIMRKASNVAPKTYKDNWVPPPHFPQHYYRPGMYNLEFIISDRYPDDERKIFLGGDPPCFSVLVLKKMYGGQDSVGKPE